MLKIPSVLGLGYTETPVKALFSSIPAADGNHCNETLEKFASVAGV